MEFQNPDLVKEWDESQTVLSVISPQDALIRLHESSNCPLSYLLSCDVLTWYLWFPKVKILPGRPRPGCAQQTYLVRFAEAESDWSGVELVLSLCCDGNLLDQHILAHSGLQHPPHYTGISLLLFMQALQASSNWGKTGNKFSGAEGFNQNPSEHLLSVECGWSWSGGRGTHRAWERQHRRRSKSSRISRVKSGRETTFELW